jgi:hypothetical protein
MLHAHARFAVNISGLEQAAETQRIGFTRSLREGQGQRGTETHEDLRTDQSHALVLVQRRDRDRVAVGLWPVDALLVPRDQSRWVGTFQFDGLKLDWGVGPTILPYSVCFSL